MIKIWLKIIYQLTYKKDFTTSVHICRKIINRLEHNFSNLESLSKRSSAFQIKKITHTVVYSRVLKGWLLRGVSFSFLRRFKPKIGKMGMRIETTDGDDPF